LEWIGNVWLGRFGVEIPLHENFTLRGGVDQIAFDGSVTSKPSAGFSLLMPTVSWKPVLSYGFVAEPYGTGGIHLLSLTASLNDVEIHTVEHLMAVLATIGIIYGVFVGLTQTDLKYVVAYSSVSHMGIVGLGLSTITAEGLSGAVFQMFAHGLSSAMMFMLVGVVYERAHHREIARFGGIGTHMPIYFALAVVGFFASLGLPSLVGFIGEVMVFQPMAIKEISAGGAQIETAFPLQLNSLHDIRLTLGDRSIIVKGRVVHGHITTWTRRRCATAPGSSSSSSRTASARSSKSSSRPSGPDDWGSGSGRGLRFEV
jgi:hypothetical protein